MERTVFNKAQIQVLNAMAHLKTENEVLMLKQAISEFFARRADEEMEKLWNEGAWNEQTLENL